MSWKTVKQRIMNHNCASQTWQSEQKSLLYVIEKAKKLSENYEDDVRGKEPGKMQGLHTKHLARDPQRKSLSLYQD